MARTALAFPVDLPLEEVRAMAHEAIDKWVDGLASLFEQQNPAQLTDLSNQFQKSRQELLGACMKALVEKLYAGYLSACPAQAGLDQRWPTATGAAQPLAENGWTCLRADTHRQIKNRSPPC